MIAATRPSSSEAEFVSLILPELTRFLGRVRGDAIDREGAIPASLREGAANLGLFGLTIPTAYGGSGLTLGGASRIVAEIARVDRSLAIMIGLHAGLGTRALVEHGSTELQGAWLPRLAAGACIASFAATEANAGSDLMSVRTRGEATPEGLCIDGEKSYVTNGGFAGLFTVLVHTPGLGGARAFSLVCVPRTSAGLKVGPEEDKLGIRGSSTVPVHFDRVVVPWSHVLGAPGRGTELTNELLAWGRTLMSAGCVGTGRAALDASLEYVGTRRQFGKPIGAFGATQAHIAWMAARLHAMDALVQAVGDEHASGMSIDLSSACAKVLTSEGAFAMCDRAVQLHGALGFLEPTGVARMLRDARITRIFEGANDVLLVRIGAARLMAPQRSVRVATPVDDLEDRLAAAIATARAELGLGIVKHQLVLQRIAQVEIAMRAMRAVMDEQPSAPLSELAVSCLREDAELALSAIGRATRDERTAREVAESLYGE